MTYYVGNSFDNLVYQEGGSRYFYGLRKDADGTLYLAKVDQITEGESSLEINMAGDPAGDWEYFEVGIDFFDGKDPDTKELVYPNLRYEQYKFDSKNLFYYINANGELVVRLNQPHVYPEDV